MGKPALPSSLRMRSSPGRPHTTPLACQLCLARLANYIAGLREARAGRAAPRKAPRQ